MTVEISKKTIKDLEKLGYELEYSKPREKKMKRDDALSLLTYTFTQLYNYIYEMGEV